MRSYTLIFSICLHLLSVPVQMFGAEHERKLFAPDHTLEVLEYVQKWLPKDPIIIEAGSYDGADTVRIAEYWLQGTVFTFEPVSELFSYTLQRTSQHSNIKCFPYALSDVTESKHLYVSQMENSIFASSSILKPKEHLDFYPEISFLSPIVVEGVALDDWAARQGVTRVDFLWLDMQGSELDMLKNSQLAAQASVIYTEVEFLEAYAGQYLYQDICAWMTSQGFELVGADFLEDQKADLISKRRFWGNCLFVKSTALRNL